MLPVLFNFGPIKIYSFGVFLVLAFFWGTFLLWKNFRLTSYKESDVFDSFFLAIGLGLILSRFFYVLFNFKYFGFDILKILLVNGYPGLSIYGFIIGFVFFLIFYCYKKNINFFSFSDYFVGPGFLALMFGKFGSFFSGSEPGKKTDFFLRTVYFGIEGERHLTAFYEATLFFISFLVAQKILFRIRTEKLPKGSNFIFFLWSFSFIYWLFDSLKENRLFFGSVPFNQLFSFVLLLTTTLIIVYYFRKFFLDYGSIFIKKIYSITTKNLRERKGKDSS